MLNAVYIYNLRSKTHIVELVKFYTANSLKTTAILKTSQNAPLKFKRGVWDGARKHNFRELTRKTKIPSKNTEC